jgi:hypothetical protein
MQGNEPRVAVLSTEALGRLSRWLWALCVLAYLTVFVGGVLAGGSEVFSVARGLGFAGGLALIGRIGLNLLSQAEQPISAPTDDQDRTLGSLVDLVSSPNVGEPHDDSGTL